jgi:hypothetical protein
MRRARTPATFQTHSDVDAALASIERLERAWRSVPNMLRLRRWLGSTGTTAALRQRTAEALAACPKQAHRQRGFLHVLLGEFEPAAMLLGEASGLGWSQDEHPGHLLFPLFEALLGNARKPSKPYGALSPRCGMDIDELESMIAGKNKPCLTTPDVGLILKQAGVAEIHDAKAREAVLNGMRAVAEHRIAGVTENKRRNHYGHAAELVAACVACDGSSRTLDWAFSLRTEYRRFPALRAELDRAMRSS